MELPNGLAIRTGTDPSMNFWVRIPSSLGDRIKRTKKRLREYGLILQMHAELAEMICVRLDKFDAYCDQLDEEKKTERAQ